MDEIKLLREKKFPLPEQIQQSIKAFENYLNDTQLEY